MYTIATDRRKQPIVYYVCDRKRCEHCAKDCNHTTDINHALYATHSEFIFHPDPLQSSEWEVVRE